MKKLLVFLLLISFVQAGTMRVTIKDNTGQGYNNIQLYQNDSISRRWIKTLVLNESEPYLIGTGVNYVFYLEPTTKSIYTNPTNPRIANYWYYISFTVVLIMILMIILVRSYYKAKRGNIR